MRFFTSSLVLLACLTPSLASVKRQAVQPAWRSKTCSEDITNTSIPADQRWAAADASTALRDLFAAWTNPFRNYSGDFSQFAGQFFGGPKDIHCARVDEVSCSVTLQCPDAKYSAGYLILNSLTKMHRFQQQYQQALDQLRLEMLGELDLFVDKFGVSGIDSDVKISRDLINSVYVMVSTAQTSTKNDYFSAGLTPPQRDQIKTANERSFGFSWTCAQKLVLPRRNQTRYGKLPDLARSILDQWKAAETEFLRVFFSPQDADTVGLMSSWIDNGLVIADHGEPDSARISANLKHLFYMILIRAVWQVHPNAMRPFLLQTGMPCGTDPGELNSGFQGWISGDDHPRAAACYGGALFYLLDVNQGQETGQDSSSYSVTDATSDLPVFKALTGADQFDLTAWGNVSKTDIIESAYGAYLKGGRTNGAFELVETAVSADTQSDLWFGKGSRLPGYVSLPVCRNMWNIINNIKLGMPAVNPNWPCEVVAKTWGGHEGQVQS